MKKKATENHYNWNKSSSIAKKIIILYYFKILLLDYEVSKKSIEISYKIDQHPWATWDQLQNREISFYSFFF